WFASLGILGRCADGERLAHEWSRPYPRYDPKETGAKLRHALQDAGPVTCAWISSELGQAHHCEVCPHRGKVKTPLILGTDGAQPLQLAGEARAHWRGEEAGSFVPDEVPPVDAPALPPLPGSTGPGAHSANSANIARGGPSWDLPLTFSEFHVPPFPLFTLPTWLREFVGAESVATQTPADLAAMLGLDVLA